MSKRAGKFTLDPSHPSLNCYRLVDATELWAPERPDTETVSFSKQSISRTLDIKPGTHTIIHYLFNTCLFTFQICTYRPVQCTHTIVYIIYSVFLYFVHYLFIYYSLLSVSCPVTVILLHCGASVTIANSPYVWQIKLILILIVLVSHVPYCSSSDICWFVYFTHEQNSSYFV